MALYASEKQQEKGETVMLKEIICQGQNVFIVVDTTWSVYKTDHDGPNLIKIILEPMS